MLGGNPVPKYIIAAIPLTPPPVTLLGIRKPPQPSAMHSKPNVIKRHFELFKWIMVKFMKEVVK